MVRDSYISLTDFGSLLQHISSWSYVKYLVSLLQPCVSFMKSSDEAPNHSETAVRLPLTNGGHLESEDCGGHWTGSDTLLRLWKIFWEKNTKGIFKGWISAFMKEVFSVASFNLQCISKSEGGIIPLSHSQSFWDQICHHLPASAFW